MVFHFPQAIHPSWGGAWGDAHIGCGGENNSRIQFDIFGYRYDISSIVFIHDIIIGEAAEEQLRQRVSLQWGTQEESWCRWAPRVRPVPPWIHDVHSIYSSLHRVIVAITSAIGDFSLQENTDGNYSSAVHAKCLLCDKPVLGNIHTYIQTYIHTYGCTLTF